MFGRDKFKQELNCLITTTHRMVESALHEQARIEETQKLANLYWALGEHCFRMFYKSMEWLYLTHAGTYFELAVDSFKSIGYQPSLFIQLSRDVVEKEKLFYGNEVSRDYLGIIASYRTIPRVPEQEARHQNNAPSDHPFFEQNEVKRLRMTIPDAAHDLPGLEGYIVLSPRGSRI